MSAPLLRGSGLVRTFRGASGGTVRAVDGVDIELRAGEVLGLVGESGSGKSTLGRLLLRMQEPEAGRVELEGRVLVDRGTGEAVRGEALRRLRSRMQLVHQSASASLNPGLTVEQHLRETISLHRPQDLPRADALIDRFLREFRLTGKRSARPGRLSGGEKRRVGLLRCLLPRPAVLVADEPTTGLDAAVKSEVTALLRAAVTEDTAMLLISHELDVVRAVADRVLVMFAGRIVQEMPAGALTPETPEDHLHPYTAALLASGFGSGRPLPPRIRRDPAARPACPYALRCPATDPESHTWARCLGEQPALRRGVEGRVACHLADARPDAP